MFYLELTIAETGKPLGIFTLEDTINILSHYSSLFTKAIIVPYFSISCYNYKLQLEGLKLIQNGKEYAKAVIVAP